MPIPIVFCCDENYFPHLRATIASIVHNRDACDEFHFFLIHNGFSESKKKKLRDLARSRFDFIEIDLKQRFGRFAKTIRKFDVVSLMTYARLLIPELVFGYDKVIYMDCDIIVRGSLSGLMEIDLGDNFIGGCSDFNCGLMARTLDTDVYVNAGVLVMNCALWRKYKMSRTSIKYWDASRYRLKWHDQDLLNSLFRKKMMLIDSRYNYAIVSEKNGIEREIPYYGMFFRPIVYHYILRKPWKFRRVCRFRWLYLKYRILSFKY
ncbi:MAG: glycosyltransferase family 8 protein [Rickettsiales bacterium]|jgi:lipopolysaccharide biosynthesis glycosyltransferase|nr:glycosyltransferase family 8 protein [Rickettsiales bacterium]